MRFQAQPASLFVSTRWRQRKTPAESFVDGSSNTRERSRDGAVEVEVKRALFFHFPRFICDTHRPSIGRYLLCEVNVSKRNELLLLDDRSIAAAVKAAVARMHGDYGAALCSIRFTGKPWWKK